MNKAKVKEEDYINFLIGSPKVYTCTEAARVQPEKEKAPAHDALTRLLERLEPSAEKLFEEVEALINKAEGILVVDDSTLDKPYAKKINLVSHHWSGKHHRVVKGINLVSMVWTNGDLTLPCDYEVYDKEEGLTKNDLFSKMLQVAYDRGFSPECIGFDSWYSSLDNLKRVRNFGWIWLTRLVANRQVNPDRTGNRALSEVDIGESGTEVHLKGYGMIKVFKIVSKKGDIEYWATNNLEMDVLKCLSLGEQTWGIEEYHRGIKQNCGIERCQARSTRSQINHIGLSIRAFVRFAIKSYRCSKSWFELKQDIIRDAVRSYLEKPYINLETSTA